MKVRALLIVPLVLAVLGACNRGSVTPPDVGRPDGGVLDGPGTGEVPADGSGSQQEGTTTTGGDGGSDGQGGSGGSGVSVDDRKTFAYGTTDLATLATDTAEISSTASALATDLASLNASAAQSDADTLEKQAKALSKDAASATDRMEPLHPRDGTLPKAQQDCLDVYALAGEYADTALDAVDAIQSASTAQLRKVADEAQALVGTADDLEASTQRAISGLEKWAEANPAEAATALAKYGG